jgi:hypothetical protein
VTGTVFHLSMTIDYTDFFEVHKKSFVNSFLTFKVIFGCHFKIAVGGIPRHRVPASV